ncbi:MAG: bifunctional riboflavin kinase/FMN adenylyltransferase [Pirellula sp.]|jgi:riboflavin kinase/FMN adenylyltransferase
MSASWLPSLPESALGGVVAIGNFDGVHRGHECLLRLLKKNAEQWRAPTVAVTFNPPPIKLLSPGNASPSLTTIPRRIELLKDAGADYVVVLQTNFELLNLDAHSFFDQLLLQGLKIRGLIEGPNFRFGKNRGGDVGLLKQLCSNNGIMFQVVEPELCDGEWISSTRIRQTIDAGNIRLANQLLTTPYRISGIVSLGAQRGRTLGFPTANLEDIPVQVPAVGVYAARVVAVSSNVKITTPSQSIDASNHQEQNRERLIGKPVALHIGPNPTFGENARKVEAHILHFSGDLYGCDLEIEIIDNIRSVTKFDSLEALKNQLNQDVALVDLIVKQGIKK